MDLQSLRELCLSFPGASEDVKWGNDLCFCVGGKMFCVTGLEPGGGITVKVPDDRFAELCELTGVAPAHYVGRYKWITIDGFERFSDGTWCEFVKESYDLIVAKLPKSARPKAK